MTEHNFPNFFKWTYTKWYFWFIVILYSIWSGYESLVNGSIGEIIGVLIATIIISSVIFLLCYMIAKHNYEKGRKR